MSKFKVGDVCITLPVQQGPQLVPSGTEVTVLECGFHPADGSPSYRITDDDIWCKECALRLKPPPVNREDIGSWDLCPWQPNKVSA